MENEDIKTNEDEVKIIRTTSSFDCGGRCPLLMHVKNGKIIKKIPQENAVEILIKEIENL